MSFKGEITIPDLAEMLKAMTWGKEEALAESTSRYFTIEKMTDEGTVVYLDCKLAKPPREIRPGVFEIEFVPPQEPPPLLSINRFLSPDEAEARWGLERLKCQSGARTSFAEVHQDGERWIPIYGANLNLAGYERVATADSQSHDDWRALNE